MKRLLIIVISHISLGLTFFIVSCATPKQSEVDSFVINKSTVDTEELVIKFLIFRNFRIDKNDNNHLQAFLHTTNKRQHWETGDTVDIWIKQLTDNKVQVYMDSTIPGSLYNSTLDRTLLPQLQKYMSNR